MPSLHQTRGVPFAIRPRCRRRAGRSSVRIESRATTRRSARQCASCRATRAASEQPLEVPVDAVAIDRRDHPALPPEVVPAEVLLLERHVQVPVDRHG